MKRKELKEYVDEGLSQQQIALRCGCSKSTVRYWLKIYGLKTLYRSRGESSPEVIAARAADASECVRECRHHGLSRFVRDSQGAYRCAQCRSDAVIKRRRRVKEQLVAEFGGACVICGYDRSIAGLHFHHIDPQHKRFGIAAGGTARAIDRLREEAAKCVLLCSNCHAEVERGITELPVNSVVK